VAQPFAISTSIEIEKAEFSGMLAAGGRITTRCGEESIFPQLGQAQVRSSHIASPATRQSPKLEHAIRDDTAFTVRPAVLAVRFHAWSRADP